MVNLLDRTPRRLLAVLPGAFVVLALGGCTLKHPTANLVNGKQLFVQHCGSCHTLAHASSSGVTGPNLDDAFRQDRIDGVKSTSIQGLVDYWIQYPNNDVDSGAVMPAKLVEGQEAQDVAAYVAHVAAIPGQDTGQLQEAVPNTKQTVAKEQNGQLHIDADPTGQLKFTSSSAVATPGHVTIVMHNPSSVSHDIAIQGNGVNEVGPIVGKGGTSTVSAALKPGRYTFYCSVPGHRQAGMVGLLVVK
jgi:uncharacterized cupredoxin-like copper-binding protein